MYQYKRILVGLDLSEMDVFLIKYVSSISQIFNVDKVYFVHVAKTLEIPEPIREKYPDLLAPVDEAITRQIQISLDKHFSQNTSYEAEINVIEGNPTDQLLKWAKVKEIDLIVMGTKDSLKGTGILPGKILKIAHCSVLFVPEREKFNIGKIVVPIDFSKHSKIALEKALAIADKAGAEIVCQNIYEVPWGYHTTGKNYEEFAEIMKGHAQKDFEAFMQSFDLAGHKLRCEFVLDESGDPAEKVYAFARKEQANLLVIGSKGRTAIASVLLGSIAEKLARHNKDISQLVVKEKNENLSFLKALLQI